MNREEFAEVVKQKLESTFSKGFKEELESTFTKGLEPFRSDLQQVIEELKNGSLKEIKGVLEELKKGNEERKLGSGSTPDKYSVSKDDYRELKNLRAQMRGMEILCQQNAALEQEVQKLCGELDEFTKGVTKKGYLYKWRERELSYASRWGLRYFALQGNKLSYFGDEHENRPRRVFELSKCFIREEGTKRGGIYHVFGIYLALSIEDANEGSLLLRLSCESGADASQWADMLEQACAVTDEEFVMNNDLLRNTTSNAHAHDSNSNLNQSNASAYASASNDLVSNQARGHGKNDSGCEEEKFGIGMQLSVENLADEDYGSGIWKGVKGSPVPITGESPSPILSPILSPIGENCQSGDAGEGDELGLELSDVEGLNPIMLRRVKSSSLILQRSLSRQKVARQILQKRAPGAYTASGSRLSTLVNTTNPRSAHAAVEKGGGKSKSKTFPAFKPMHVMSVASALSYEASQSNGPSYRGFFHLSIIIMFLSHLEIIMTNMQRYGLQVASFTREKDNVEELFVPLVVTAVRCLISWCVSIGAVLTVEKIALRSPLTERMILILNFIIGACNIFGPCAAVWFGEVRPTINMIYLFQSVILWMKLVSYSHANKDLRVANRRAKKADLLSSQSSGHFASGASSPTTFKDNNAKPIDLKENLHTLFSEVKDVEYPFLLYPQNVSIPNISYFMVAPTLCYQLNYPRTTTIRWKYVLFLGLRLFVVFVLMVFSVEQYILPVLTLTLTPMKEMDVPTIIERLLRLSIPNTYVWLLMFYFYFHLWMNFCAELTRFGDRQFYKDWWNARTIDRYWRTWNIPVHNWIVRHLYMPLVRLGVPKDVATGISFLFSAVFHELIISLPFGKLSLHAFFGMMAQAPLISVTRYLDKKFNNAFIGNAIFWCLFCVLGQPMGIIMYYYDNSMK